jgi:hypothetical protein
MDKIIVECECGLSATIENPDQPVLIIKCPECGLTYIVFTDDGQYKKIEIIDERGL